MKIVIIGGGIAGLTFAILMQKKGHEVVINERYDAIPEFGNAFLVHPSGLNSLAEICNVDLTKDEFPGRSVHSFTLMSPQGDVMRSQDQLKWRCMSRYELVNCMSKRIAPGSIRFSRTFSHFQFEGGRAVAAVFENGEVEYGDIFIGSDGGNSKVRTSIFGDTAFTAVEVQEILGISKNPAIATSNKGKFTKFQSTKRGLSFGFIPFSDEELIWFTQFDVSLQDTYHFGEGKIKDFLSRMLKKFPSTVNDLIETSGADQLYLWRTRDFNPLPQFHSHNIVLLGDAAHLALPFTSAGTTNAITDALELSQCLDTTDDMLEAFKMYHQNRIGMIANHINFGRKLKEAFLRPDLFVNSPVELPFIE